jgi:hypothetical protein
MGQNIFLTARSKDFLLNHVHIYTKRNFFGPEIWTVYSEGKKVWIVGAICVYPQRNATNICIKIDTLIRYSIKFISILDIV